MNVSKTSDKEAQEKLSDLGQRLNLALAQKVQELNRYRSDFFGRLRQILGNRPDIAVVGDRFVFQSSVLFEAGKADLSGAGRQSLDKLGEAALDLEREVPPDIPWVLRIDGHTDARPVSGGPFKSNWICRPREPLRWRNIWSPRASIRTISRPPALASSSRSTRARAKTLTPATAASS